MNHHSVRFIIKFLPFPLTLTGDKDKPKMRIIKASRELLEEEYDPLPLLKAVFEENVKGYRSVKELSPEYITDFKKQFNEIYKVPERRKRVTKFLDIAENKIEADTLWDFIKDTTNAFSMQKMVDDLSRFSKGISRQSSVRVEEFD